MDSDNFQPAFVVAARVLGLGDYAVNFLKTAGILLTEREFLGKGNAISWENPISKTIGSLIYGSFGGGLHTITIEADPEGAPFKESRCAIEVTGHDSIKTNRRVTIRIGSAQSPILIDGEGKSSWLQAPSFGKNRYINGVILGSGAIAACDGAVEVTRIAVGTYRIRWKAPFPGINFSVTGSDAQNSGRVFSYTNESLEATVITMRNPSTFVPEDIAFAFCATSIP